MRLIPRELDKLLIVQVGQLAQQRLSRGLKLNATEAVGLIIYVLIELIRTGGLGVSELSDIGKRILGFNQVGNGVESVVKEVLVEGGFEDGSFLVSVHDPISNLDGDPNLTFFASNVYCLKCCTTKLTKYPQEVVPTYLQEEYPLSKRQNGLWTPKPGEIIVLDKELVLFPRRRRDQLKVKNYGDRPIQVGSHYHFSETNPQLTFDRIRALGMKLDIASGTSVRFEPGGSKLVGLVELGGSKIMSGGNSLAPGPISDYIGKELELEKRFMELGFGHHKQLPNLDYRKLDVLKLDRKTYNMMYGPTVGDKIRLADTNLWVEIEYDYNTSCYGDEAVFGGGKSLREGQGQNTSIKQDEVLDLLITNAVVIDHTGIFKCDIGIKEGYIVAIGKGGNPDTMDGINMICGAETEVYSCEGKIITAGGVDTHVHFICPQLIDEALCSGVTTLIGGGTGPNTGTRATTCTPGHYNLHHMMRATDTLPVNIGFTGKGNCAATEPLISQVRAGCIGLKLHEDWGTTPAAIDACLRVCDQMDVQCTIHTDTLNESGFLESTVQAINNRTIHTYHTEGAGGGHAPDIIKICEHANVIPSSTNPTRPYTTNTLDEHVDMLMVCHHLSRDIPGDIAFAESRIRKESIAAEDVLHDKGAISIISSDSQAMGRVGEVISRTWKTAHKMNHLYGHLSPSQEDKEGKLPHMQFRSFDGGDNFRVKRYVSKYTINPAIAHGVAHIIGSVEVGKLADLVVWPTNSFGAKPSTVFKAGQIVLNMMGDPNASIPTTEPIWMRAMFGHRDASNSLLFVSTFAKENGVLDALGLRKKIVHVSRCRDIGKRDMRFNKYTPKIEVDPETYKVVVDGEDCSCDPAGMAADMPLPLNQAHFLF